MCPFGLKFSKFAEKCVPLGTQRGDSGITDSETGGGHDFFSVFVTF